MKKNFTFILLFIVFPAWAYTPMEYYNSLVAGTGKGFQDGSFDKSHFNNPTCLAFNNDGSELFVADRDNNRIRVIHVRDSNRVETVAGDGQAGRQDGPVSTATFNKPLELAYLPGDILIVYEQGSSFFRQIDLKTGIVTSLISAPPYVFNIVYRPKDNSLYYTCPGELDKLDLKTKTFKTVFKNDPLIPRPKSLCLAGGKLFVADNDLTKFYEIDPDKGDLTYMGSSENSILALGASDGNLYALQSGPHSLVCLWPKPRKVAIATAWGFFEQNNYQQAEPLISVFYDPDHAYYYCLTASPAEPRKLYLCDTSTDTCGTSSSILSIKDYDFAVHWKDTTDFDYPPSKNFNTFRILVAGDSRVITGPKVDERNPTNTSTLLTDTYAKKMELFLNMVSSEKNSRTHFEVLALSNANVDPIFFSKELVPSWVKKYDIDLVLALAPADSSLPLELLDKSLKAVQLKNGISPQLAVSYIPWDEVSGSSETSENFYEELCVKSNVPMVDIAKGFNILKTSYWPTQCLEKGYTAYGDLLIAHLLTHALIEQKLVPITSSQAPNP